MEAIVLCGGLGTRLRSVIGENQKTMTKVCDEPFLVHIVNYLKWNNINEILFATGYKSDDVKNYFGDGEKFGIKPIYVEEKEPLGTGGAIKNCYEYIKNEEVVVLNGDTIFPVQIKKLYEVYKNFNSDMSIACKKIDDKSRYGTINIKNNKVISFEEKIENCKMEEGYINGGIYIIKKNLILEIESNKKISLEKELLPKWLENKIITAEVFDEYFIDIGTPESLNVFKMKMEKEKGNLN